MSAKNAPGEVNENPNFDSPNITTAEEEEQQAIDAEKEARKKAETVDIDGVPIDEKDISFKASDISKKGKAEYFVNVEGAEQRKKEAAKKARIEAEEEEKAKKRAEKIVKKIEAEEKANNAKIKAENEKRQKAEDARVISELKKKAETRKKENRIFARQERQRKRRERIADCIEKIKYFFFGKWHKFITITVIILAIAIPSYFIIKTSIEQEQKRAEEEYQARIRKTRDEIMNLLDTDPINSKDTIYSDIISIDEDEQTEMSAVDVMNIANYYHDEELYQEYLQKCKDRGGCQDDSEGKG